MAICPGDLMTALLLGWSARLPGRLRDAVLHAVAALQGVLAVTAEAAGPAARATERSAEVGSGLTWS
jgi:predicted deacylase